VIKDVTDIEVYKEALNLLPEVYRTLKLLPKDELDLKWQIQRAAKSIPSNIAEGYAKHKSGKEFKRYLLISLGSSDEVISHLRTIDVLYKVDGINELSDKYKVLSKRINSLHKKWQY
jgi:four helix bundle protein